MKRVLIPALIILGALVSAFAASPRAVKRSAHDYTIERYDSLYGDIVITIDRPQQMIKGAPTYIVFFALPNTNTVKWISGRKVEEGGDRRYNIQHVGAQTRFLRDKMPDCNLLVAYMGEKNRSWPTYIRNHERSGEIVRNVIDSITNLYKAYDPRVVLSGHSGGGRVLLRYIEQVREIPDHIERIVILDSDYAYDDALHLDKLVEWLDKSKRHTLFTSVYCDSVVVSNGKNIVSPRGGTWYRTGWLRRGLAEHYDFKSEQVDSSLTYYEGKRGQIQMWFKMTTPEVSYHSTLVDRNGFIQSMLGGTKLDGDGYVYWGDRAYNNYIEDHPQTENLD